MGFKIRKAEQMAVKVREDDVQAGLSVQPDDLQHTQSGIHHMQQFWPGLKIPSKQTINTPTPLPASPSNMTENSLQITYMLQHML